MAPASGFGRAWSTRSLSNASSFPAEPTPITEHTARLHEPTKNETPTQLACPLRSRYVWSGDGRSPSVGNQQQQRGGGVGGSRGENEQPQRHRQPPERRYSSFEAYVLGGNVLDGENGWWLGSSSSNLTGSADLQQNNDNNPTSSAGSTSVRTTTGSSSRASFFFGADYSGSTNDGGGSHNKARVDQAAARLPPGHVDPKAAAVLGVAGSADSAARGGVASKAQRFLGVGRRVGEEGIGEIPALLDESSPDLSSCGEGSASPRHDEPPPSLDPLTDPPRTGSGMCSRRLSQTSQADADVRVAFPSGFRANHKIGSGSEEDSSNGSQKARGSGASLGTKSGSTSLLSMTSGSPRSISSTAQDMAAADSPRTPLSDHSSTGTPGEVCPGRRDSGTSSSGRIDRTADAATCASDREVASHKSWGASSTQRENREQLISAVSVSGADTNEELDDADVPSANPTPLSRPVGDTGYGSRGQSLSSRSIDSDGKVAGDSKPVNPAATTFRQRLKYWNSAASGRSSAAGENVTTATTTVKMATKTATDAAPSATAPKKDVLPTAISSSGSKNQSRSDITKREEARRPSVGSSRSNLQVDGRGSHERSGSHGRVTDCSSEPVSVGSSCQVGRNVSRGRVADGSSERCSGSSSRQVVTRDGGGDVVWSTSANKVGGRSRRVGGSDGNRDLAAKRPSAGSSSGSSPQIDPSQVESPPPYCESVASGTGGSSPTARQGVSSAPHESVTVGSQSRRTAAPPPAYRPGNSNSNSGSASDTHAPVVQVKIVPGTGSSGSATVTLKGSSPPYSSSVARSGESSSRTGSRSSPPRQGETQAESERAASPAVSPTLGNFGAAHRNQLEARRIASQPRLRSGTEVEEKAVDFGASRRAELEDMRRARDSTLGMGEEMKEDDSDAESEMDWDANSDQEAEEEKTEIAAPHPSAASQTSAARREMTARGGGGSRSRSTTRDVVEPLSQDLQPLRSPRDAAPPPPRYMAIVEAAEVTSALNHSSTSELDTSPSEDDGGMMAEILTDRLMEVCNKMDHGAATPADDLSDGGSRHGGRRTGTSRRRQASGSGAAGDAKGGDGDSDNGSVMGAGAAARKQRRERLRRRSRQSRKLALALNVPKDEAGEPIQLHMAAYHGEADILASYISQGGDLEARDRFQATALMLCAERGHTEMVDALLCAGADPCRVDENGNSALHLASFYGRSDAVELLLSTDADVAAIDSEGRTPLDLATDPVIRRMIRTEEMVRLSGQSFDLLGAVEVNDTLALANFIGMGQEACGYPHNPNAITVAAKRLRLDQKGRGGMTAVHLAAFHGYSDTLRLLLEAGSDPNAVCDDGETPLHTACTGGSMTCASLLLEYGANPLATDANGLVPCEKHIAGGRQEMKLLLERKAFQATPSNLMALREDLAEVALQIDAGEELFVRKGVAIKYLRRALKKKDADLSRLRQAVEARDTDIRNLTDRMDSVHLLLKGVSVQ